MTNLADAFHHAIRHWDRQKDGDKTYSRAQKVMALIATSPEKWTLDEVDHTHLEQAARSLEGQGLGPATVNRYIAAFRGIWRLSHATPPPFTTRQEPPGRQHIPTEAQLKEMLAWLEGRTGIREVATYDDTAMALIILKETGLRVSELLALTRHDVDPQDDWITVADSKSGEGRRIPTTHYIAMLCYGNIPLKLDYSAFIRRWNECKKSLSLPDWLTPHTLRHYRASKLAEAGISVPIIAELLGHSSWKTTMRYTHVSKQALRDAVTLQASTVEGVGGTHELERSKP